MYQMKIGQQEEINGVKVLNVYIMKGDESVHKALIPQSDAKTIKVRCALEGSKVQDNGPVWFADTHVGQLNNQHVNVNVPAEMLFPIAELAMTGS